MNPGWSALLWFAAIVAAIPLVLWLLKRTPMGGGHTLPGLPRPVAVTPLSATQRLVTIEVGRGEERLWLVLGVTPQKITTLHTMTPLAEPAGTLAPGGPQAATFHQLLNRLRQGSARGAGDHAR